MKFSELKNIASKYDEIFIYGFGLAGKWLQENLGHSAKSFIDTDHKKKGEIFNGVGVITYEQALSQVGSGALIINTVIDIQDVSDLIKRIKHDAALPLGLYLDDIEIMDSDGIRESKDFLRYSLEAVRKCHQGYFNEDKLFLRSVDLVITEKCSLKCVDCSNLMQYYEKPIDVDFSEIKGDFEKLLENVEFIYEVRLIGGEPFMNKEIYAILEYLLKIDKIEKIVIYTNATIPIKDDKLNILKDKKIIFSVTDYGEISKNTPKVLRQLTDYGLTCRVHRPEYWTDSGKIHYHNRSEKELEEIFDQCCGKNLTTLSSGRLYRCPFAANADRLGAIPSDRRNSVLVTDSELQIKNYTREINYLPACNYCNGRSFDSPMIIPAIQTKKPITYIKQI